MRGPASVHASRLQQRARLLERCGVLVMRPAVYDHPPTGRPAIIRSVVDFLGAAGAEKVGDLPGRTVNDSPSTAVLSP